MGEPSILKTDEQLFKVGFTFCFVCFLLLTQDAGIYPITKSSPGKHIHLGLYLRSLFTKPVSLPKLVEAEIPVFMASADKTVLACKNSGDGADQITHKKTSFWRPYELTVQMMVENSLVHTTCIDLII